MTAKSIEFGFVVAAEQDLRKYITIAELLDGEATLPTSGVYFYISLIEWLANVWPIFPETLNGLSLKSAHIVIVCVKVMRQHGPQTGIMPRYVGRDMTRGDQ